MTTIFLALLQGAILAYALLAGVFLAFSDFIMRSLARTSGSGGVEAMQVINREVFRWVFMILFMGMAPVSLLLSGFAAMNLETPADRLILLAGLVYLAGCFGVTVIRNVPMNERLAAMEPATATVRDYWTGTYLPRWTFWNTVRTIACALSSVLLMTAVIWKAGAL
ncbi:Uncharacterized membrane protein [Mameliella alba]|uniref:anthrone oxygenase family protein n=1 Tax=Mameliella alba TaxID=561184 RepID=UPI0008874195|nr:anthrone oxygenase family protein [Mameliella alba]OWV48702.1 hypothetical protein CDZ96_08860 [Mameliella alba]PTR39266.1 putative membrane protein [Mameliella alba]GGF64520.1 hypothetical protein GCM10011319_26950 [Mameliella alba]SDD28762.1 Uncharacterized membrane protein [Mameliella alba]